MNTMANVVAVTEHMEEAGAIVLWHLSGEMDGEVLKAGWAMQGLDENMLPEMPSVELALRRTANQYKGPHRLVRTLPNCGGYAIVDEVVEGGKLTYRQVFDFMNSGDGISVTVYDEQALIDAGGVAQATNLFERTKAMLNHQDASYWLSRLVRNVDSISLRDRGGVYFVPRNRLEEWRAYVAAIRASSSHMVYEIPALRSDEAVAAIIDSLTRESEDEAIAIEAELENGDLGGRAIKTRGERCEAMSRKVASYEQLLGRGLDTLRERLERLQANVAAAALASSAPEETV